MKKVYEFLNKLAIPLEKVIFFVRGSWYGSHRCHLFVQVIFRLMGRSLSWSEEISRYIEVWIVFLTAGYALGKGPAHLHGSADSHSPQKVNFFLKKSTL